jgi:cation diffusion facilitator family transporter
MAEGSTRVVYAALAGNFAIVVTKLAAFALTGSSAMFTEAVHSAVDTLDQVFLLLGLRRSARPADTAHPFGHGMEIYFWSFVVALLIFLVGGAVSIGAGVYRIMHPAPIDHPWVNFVVLAASASFEGASFLVSYREFRRIVGRRRVAMWRFLRLSKDPSLFTSLLEDFGALVGLGIAAAGIFGAAVLHIEWADGAASILIGLLLAAIALFLANETRSLIAGEAAVPWLVQSVREVLEAEPKVAVVREVLSLHLGPQSILFGVTLCFQPELNAGVVEETVQALTARIEQVDPRIERVYLRPTPLSDFAQSSSSS